MKRYLLYFLPSLLLLLAIIAQRSNVVMLDIETVVYVRMILNPLFLLSIYWAVGFWTPGQISQTVISVVMGIGLLFFAMLLCSFISGLYLAILAPFFLMGLAFIRRYYL